MSDFVKEIHNMFDHIWDCEIDHPVYQDTVGELMEAVIQTYEKHKPTHGTNLASLGTDCISRQAAIEAVMECYDNDELFEVYEDKLRELPPIQPDNNLQKLADEIASFKRRVKSDNSDYLTGYLCAFSVVEGMIADMRREATT